MLWKTLLEVMWKLFGHELKKTSSGKS
jgi:hypothetical protein